MRLDKDDPRIIDFALGELEAEEHQQIAKALEAEENADAKVASAEYEKLIVTAKTEFETESADTLSAMQRKEVLASAEKENYASRFAGIFLRLSAAAAILFIVGSLIVPNTASYKRGDVPAPRLAEVEYESRYRMQSEAAENRAEQSAAVSHAIPDEALRRMGSLGYLSGDELGALEAIGYLGDGGGGASLDHNTRQELEALGYIDFEESIIGNQVRLSYDSTAFRPMYDSDWSYRTSPGTESYATVRENRFKRVTDAPLSTFSIDVDTASYSNVRRFLTQGQFPPPDAVRIEELLNYFDYDYPQPEGDQPFAVDVEAGPCPWRPGHTLAKIGLQGYEMPASERPRGNFVFLLDVSGSMNAANKLPLVKESMRALLQELRPDDRVAIVTYASSSAVHLRSTRCDEKEEIARAIESLSAGGSTHGSAGIRDAYKIARRYFVEGGVNRVILATDGDFNVGVTNHEELMQLIEQEAKSNVFLTALGFGMGNIKDHTLEQLADRGNGHYAYIDDFKEARKTLVEQLNGALVTIAKDVKIQVEFNPAQVGAYRLIGYENRVLAAKDFNDDTKDAGEIGAGHTVTALYELVPPGGSTAPGVDPLKYQSTPPLPELDTPQSDELMTVKLRWKEPEGDTSTKIEVPVRAVERRSRDLDFAASVAGFGMLLRNSQYRGTADWTLVRDLAEAGRGDDDTRDEFFDLVIKAKTMAGR